jgi:hypothetical protein
MDRSAKQYAGKDFASMYLGLGAPITIPTLTVAGTHDDNRWLNNRKVMNNTEILNNVHWLAQGYRTSIGWDNSIRVTGLGRAYSEATYNGKNNKKKYRHYTRHDIERACSAGPTDLLVVYDHLDSPGIRNVIFATRPKLILTVARENTKQYKSIQNIPVVALGRQETQRIAWTDKYILAPH